VSQQECRYQTRARSELPNGPGCILPDRLSNLAAQLSSSVDKQLIVFELCILFVWKQMTSLSRQIW